MKNDEDMWESFYKFSLNLGTRIVQYWSVYEKRLNGNKLQENERKNSGRIRGRRVWVEGINEKMPVISNKRLNTITKKNDLKHSIWKKRVFTRRKRHVWMRKSKVGSVRYHDANSLWSELWKWSNEIISIVQSHVSEIIAPYSDIMSLKDSTKLQLWFWTKVIQLYWSGGKCKITSLIWIISLCPPVHVVAIICIVRFYYFSLL